MAVDKLVDSTQLNADLTTVANAIRTKGGTGASLSFPSGMAQAIASIPSGGIPDFIGSLTLNPNKKASLPSTMEIDCTNIISLRSFESSIGHTMPYGASSCNELVLRNLQNGIDLTYFAENGGIPKITFDGGVKPSTMRYFSSDTTGHTTECQVLGEIDLSGLTASLISTLVKTIEIHFKPNSLSLAVNEASKSTWTNQVAISLANALKESVSNTITLKSSARPMFDLILGTVSLDETQTYHIFTADVNGTTTLTEFITQTKGWTLA